MFALRQRWNRYAVRAGLVTLAIATAWGMRQTDGALVYEMYRWVTSPLQPGASRQEILAGSYTQELQQRLVELEVQNRELQDMVGTAPAETGNTILAAVIGRSAGDWWQQVVISRGSRDGVREGYIVTGPGGLIGRVIAVSPSSSRVLLVSDATSRVGARISRSRATGYVRGQTGQQVIMEFFDKMPDVREGDVVVTSAYSQLFPADMPIGRVVDLDLGKSPAPEVTIELSAPLSVLEWVRVIPFTPTERVDSSPLLEGNPEADTAEEDAGVLESQ
jgi:rod shape-determining protein MreC